MQTISPEDWHDLAKKVQVSKEDMNKLVLNFFMSEGYRDTAITFSRETNTNLSNDELEKMTDRINMKQSILNGDIDGALQMLTKCENNSVLFKLKIQKLIELIKLNQVDQAIIFAQSELTPYLTSQPHLIEEIEQAMSLLAFEDLNQSPMNCLIQNQQRIQVAHEINKYMISLDGNGQQSAKLTILMKLLQWSQKALSQKLNFPELDDISTGRFKKGNHKDN